MRKHKALKFIGTGSCFNVRRINNSAYYYNKKNGTLVLFDCGESIFDKLVKKFKRLNKVIVIITHLHSDHVGSLPSFIAYCNIIFLIKPIIIFPDKSIINLLKQMGIENNSYVYKSSCNFIKETVKIEHAKNLNCYGYILNLFGKVIYYSGDSKTLSNKVLVDFIEGKIDYIYHDMTRFNNTIHANVLYLAKIIPKSLRKDVYAMHLDDLKTELLARLLRFNIAK